MNSEVVWKLNRLRTMRGGEIFWRIGQTLQTKAEALGIGLAPALPVSDGVTGRGWYECLPSGFDTSSPYVDAADLILAGKWDVFTLKNLQLGFPPRWNCDPKTGTEAPLIFGKILNYRDERLVGDIKCLWEPNRHLELVTLAQAWYLTGDEKYSMGCRTLLESWFEQCPYPLGPNWTSSLEHALRLANWAVAWHLLGGNAAPLFKDESGAAFRQRWLDSVFRHSCFIAGFFSRHSSANNHLFGELMGLFISSVTWPIWPQSAKWLENARRGLEKQTLLQVAPDGVDWEQAIWYHHEVADMMLLCGLFGRANVIEFCPGYWNRLEAMLDFIASMMDAGGNVPMIGDSDDAVMVRFSQEPGFNVYRSLLATGAVLFRRADFKARAGHFDDKSRWLLGDDGANQFETLPKRIIGDPPKRTFPEGGYWILGCDFGTDREIRLVADAGPLGYLSIAAHGHADALAVTLFVGGREMLIDPGTYAYHTQKKWRDYFRGTSAHNTVRIDGQDQSVSGGNFLWIKHAHARCERWVSSDEQDVFVGSHDGYRRLKDPVTHRREIVFDKTERQVEVTDSFECRREHFIEIYWHFAETCDVVTVGNEVIARNGVAALKMTMPDASWQPRIVKACDDPPLGWVSRRFDEKVPTSTVVWSGSITGMASLCSLIRID